MKRILKVEFDNGLVVEKEILETVDVNEAVYNITKNYEYYEGPVKAKRTNVYINNEKIKENYLWTHVHKN